MTQLATVIDVSRKFGVCVETVRQWVRQNRIPCLRPSRKIIRFDLKEVEKALHHECRNKYHS